MEAVGNSGGALIHCSAQLRSWAASEVKAKKEVMTMRSCARQ